jgi:hypothetical protein
VTVALVGGVVSEVTISHHRINYRVGQIIERFGEPEAYAPSSGVVREDSSCEKEWDNSRYDAYPSSAGYLLYPSQGVTVLVLIPDGYKGCLYPEMWTSQFWYFRPRSLTDALQEEQSVALAHYDWSNEDLAPWIGYGAGY